MLERHRRIYSFNKPAVIWPILFQDDCEGVFLWKSQGSGADWTADYDETIAYVGAHSLRLVTKSTDPAIDDYVAAHKNLWVPPYRMLTFIFCFYRSAGTNSDLIASFKWYDGANAHAAALKFLTSGSAIHYLDSGATYKTVTDWKWNTGTVKRWNFCSLTLNLANNEYAQLTVNHQVKSLAGTGYAVTEDPTLAYLDLWFSLETRAANQAGCRIDQILLRGDNP